ncbi:MAG: HEAT repeat domain-containing protein [bacterium]
MEALVTHLNAEGSLNLDVEEGRLLYEEEQVYSYETSQDNLAFLMFRDGIRSLSFRPGLEAGEVEAFADCLAHADDLAETDHDLATAFWEQDFTHIDYRVADPFLGGEVLREGTIDALRETVLRRLAEASLAAGSDAIAEAGDLKVVEPARVDEPSLTLTIAEVEESERTAEDPSNVLEDFALVLLEIVGGYSGNIAEDDAISRSLSIVIDSYLDSRNLDGLDFILDRLQQLEAQGRCPDGFVNLVVEAGVSKKGLGRILAGSGHAPAEEVARIEGFLTTTQRWIYPALLELLAETDDRAVRKSMLAVLGAEGGVPGSHLAPMFQDPRWYVVRNAVQLAAGSRDPGLPGQLERLLRYPDVRVRREVTRTLGTLGGGTALQGLAKALTDEDSSVRTLAVQGLGRQGGREHEATVLARVEDRNFESLPAEEIDAFLVALAVLAQDRAVPVLDRLWRRKRLRARPAPVRLAALHALGAISASAAQSVLMEAAKSGDPQVKRAATRALYEAQARRSGSHP